MEFDDVKWTRREWIRIFDIFQVFLVENTLLWAPKPEPDKTSATASKVNWPGLVSNVFVLFLDLFHHIASRRNVSTCMYTSMVCLDLVVLLSN